MKTKTQQGDSIRLKPGVRDSKFPQEGTVTRAFKSKLWVLLPIACRLSVDRSQVVKVKG